MLGDESCQQQLRTQVTSEYKMRGLPKEFFSKGIYAFCKRWRTCIERGGDYVEK